MVNAYTDINFYENSYRGDTLPESEVETWLKRASDAVNRATRFKIGDNPSKNLTPFQLERVRYAVCIAADFFYSSGSASLSEMVSSYSIGDVNVNLDNSSDAICIKNYGIPYGAYEELVSSGLMYSGV